MDKTHQIFFWFMLKNGCKEVKDTIEYIQRLDSDIHNVENLKIFINSINKKIVDQHFKIILTTCEVTCEDLVILINTKKDDISKMQMCFSQSELEYFDTILKEILSSDDKQTYYSHCLTIPPNLNNKLSTEDAEKSFNVWIKKGYFVKLNDYIYFGACLINEFGPYLRENYKDNICNLCSDLVFQGEICKKCRNKFHKYCLKKFSESISDCPKCKYRWDNNYNDSLQRSREDHSPLKKKVKRNL